MPGYGPPPAEEKRRRNADTFEGFEVTVAADERAPSAPELPNRASCEPETVAWWDAWVTSPQAAAFLATDWSRLLMLVPLVDSYWREPDTKLLAEIRLNESLLGATHTDRMRARIKVAPPKQAAAANGGSAGVSDLSARRARLLRVEA